MEQEEKLRMHIYSRLLDFVESMAVYRALYSARIHERTDIDEEIKKLWTNISDNCLQMAVVNWCKVFSSNRKNNKTHYSYLCNSTNDFRNAVSKAEIDFDQYVRSMKSFRDNYISHDDLEYEEIPFLDNALTICNIYENEVICKDPQYIPFDLQAHYKGREKLYKRYLNDFRF